MKTVMRWIVLNIFPGLVMMVEFSYIYQIA